MTIYFAHHTVLHSLESSSFYLIATLLVLVALAYIVGKDR